MSACSTYPRGHGGGTEDVDVGHMSLLTILSIDGEHRPDTFSERRGFVLRASVEILMVRYPTRREGQIKAPFAGKSARSLFKVTPIRAWERTLLKQGRGIHRERGKTFKDLLS